MFSPTQASDYVATFGERGYLYHRANERWPRARHPERQALLDLLALAPGMTVCDVPAGGGYVADGIAAACAGVRVVCVEASPAFAALIDPRFEVVVAASVERFEIADQSADALTSLAALHHIDDKAAFAREALRVMRPGGRVALADVRAGSPQALFLNDAVNRLSTTGHRGVFVAEGALTRVLAAAGFVALEEAQRDVDWCFPDAAAALSFARDLFGLVGASDDLLRAELAAAFGPTLDGDAPRIPWALTYAVGTKPLL